MNKKELAIAKRAQNYNCCQAVACAFAQEIGVPEEVIFKACEGFGAGMGCMDGTCGAISGAVMLAGFKYSDGCLANPKTKTNTYQYTSQIMKRFEEKNGSTICRELKGVDTGTPLRSCPGCLEDAVELAQEILKL